MLLLKVLGNATEVNQTRQFFINNFLTYAVSINEITRYTSLVTIEQESLLGLNVLPSKLTSSLRPRMIIRLYHDARMAEVVSTQDIRQVKPRYDYPNSQMHQQDEKQQTNQFLNEWLHLCLEFGQVHVEMPS